MFSCSMIASDLYHELRVRIIAGTLKPGTRLESIRVLADRNKMAHATAAKVVRDLARDGLIECHPGRGSFVVGPVPSSRSSPDVSAGEIIFATLDPNMFDVRDENYIGVCYGAQEELRRSGFSLRLATGNCDEHWQDQVALPTVAGLILGNIELAYFPSIRALIGKKPVVWCGVGNPPIGMAAVTVHDEDAGRLATEHLLDLGHRRLRFITGVDRFPRPFQRRYAGFCQALAQVGLQALPALGWNVITGELEAVEAVLRQVKASHPEAPTGLVVGNDAMAAEIRDRARVMGITIPDRLSLVSYGNFVRTGVPQLTTVDFDRLVVGQAAAALVHLLSHLLSHHPLSGAIEVNVPVRLIVGGTSAKPRSQ